MRLGLKYHHLLRLPLGYFDRDQLELYAHR